MSRRHGRKPPRRCVRTGCGRDHPEIHSGLCGVCRAELGYPPVVGHRFDPARDTPRTEYAKTEHRVVLDAA